MAGLIEKIEFYLKHKKLKKFAGKRTMNVTIPYQPRKQQAFIHTELDKKDLVFFVVIEGLAKR